MNSKTLSKGFTNRDYANLVKEIFNENKSIRFAAVYSGRDLISGGMRQGITSYDPEEEARELDLELARIAKSTSNSERWFGSLRGIVVTYTKLNLAIFPFERTNRFLVVSSEPAFDLFSFMAKLHEIVEKR